MTDTAKYVEQALAELELVNSEASLMGWSDTWCNSIEYAQQLSMDQVKKLEDGFERKLVQVMPAGLAG